MKEHLVKVSCYNTSTNKTGRIQALNKVSGELMEPIYRMEASAFYGEVWILWAFSYVKYVQGITEG